MSSPQGRSGVGGAWEEGHARALFPEPQPSPSRGIARAAAEARKSFEQPPPTQSPSSMARGSVSVRVDDATRSPRNTAVAAASARFSTTPPQSPPRTGGWSPQTQPRTQQTSPMTDILNLVASDVGGTYAPSSTDANASSSAAANVSAVIRAAAEAAVLASAGRDGRRPKGRFASSQASSAASSPHRGRNSAASSPARREDGNGASFPGYSLTHSPKGKGHTVISTKRTPPPLSPPGRSAKNNTSSFDEAFAALT